MVERAVILCEGDTLYPQHFLIQSPQKRDTGIIDEELSTEIPLEQTLEQTEKRLILHALAQAGNNKTRASELLQISRQSLHRRMKRLGM